MATNNQNSVNTTELARMLAQSDSGKAQKLTVSGSLQIIETLFKTVAGELAKGKTIHVHRFGNFKVLATAARKGRNPQSGEAIDIPAGKRAHFVVSSYVKQAVQEGKLPVEKPRPKKAPKAAKAKPATPKAPSAGAGFKPGQPEAPAAAAASDEI